jgi:hypothetical protein
MIPAHLEQALVVSPGRIMQDHDMIVVRHPVVARERHGSHVMRIYTTRLTGASRDHSATSAAPASLV